MNPTVDFYGIEFEAEYFLFGDEFSDLPGVYIIYTEKAVLEIGITERLKTTIEEHSNTREWLKLANGDEIFVAFNMDNNPESRADKEVYLKAKMNPRISAC